MKLQHLVSVSYNVGNRSSLVVEHIPDYVYAWNEQIFCRSDNRHSTFKFALENKAMCPIIHAHELCWGLTLLFIPCDFVLGQSGFICANHDLYKYKTYKRIIRTFPHGGIDHRYRLPICNDATYLLNYHFCNGLEDCTGGDDETNCNNVCHFYNDKHAHNQQCFTSCHRSNCSCFPLYFRCESGGCVPRSTICDCYSDCTDSSDEDAHLCSHYLCQNKSIQVLQRIYYIRACLYKTEVISVTDICDGEDNCMFGVDELADCDKISKPWSL